MLLSALRATLPEVESVLRQRFEFTSPWKEKAEFGDKTFSATLHEGKSVTRQYFVIFAFSKGETGDYK